MSARYVTEVDDSTVGLLQLDALADAPGATIDRALRLVFRASPDLPKDQSHIAPPSESKSPPAHEPSPSLSPAKKKASAKKKARAVDSHAAAARRCRRSSAAARVHAPRQRSGFL